MRDTTTLEGCHVRRFLGGSPEYRERLDAKTKPFVGACNGKPDSITMNRRDVVLLDSATVTSDSATAHLTVYYGNLMYHQSLRFTPVVRDLPRAAVQTWNLRSAGIVDVSGVLRGHDGPPK